MWTPDGRRQHEPEESSGEPSEGVDGRPRLLVPGAPIRHRGARGGFPERERRRGPEMNALVVWAACGLFVAGMACDLHRRRIPNPIPLSLLGLFGLYALGGGAGPLAGLWAHLAIGAALLGAGFALYLGGGFGAGDGKLIAVAGVWSGPADLSPVPLRTRRERLRSQPRRPAAARRGASHAQRAAVRGRDRAARPRRHGPPRGVAGHSGLRGRARGCSVTEWSS